MPENPPAENGRSAAWIVRALILVGLPASATAALHAYALHHPFLTILGWTAYEALVALLAFVSRIVSRMEEEWIGVIAQVLNTTIHRRLSGFHEEYMRYLESQVRLADTEGLAIRGDAPLRLEQIFVELGLVSTAPHQVSTDMLNDSRVSRSQESIWQHLRAANGQAVIIAGPPGCGKTTLLQHIVLTLAAKRKIRRKFGAPTRLPILLSLRKYGYNIRPELSLPALVLASLPPPLVSKAPPSWFEYYLKHGCWILLDGLDEIPDLAMRSRAAEWIEDQVALYHQSTFVITTRPFGYRFSRHARGLGRAKVLAVRPFTEDRIRHFVHIWYLAVERNHNQNDSEARQAADKTAQDLLDRMASSPALSELAVNPLLLTMIANVHCFGGKLSDRRTELYYEICSTCVARRQEAFGLTQPLTDDQLDTIWKVLEELANELMRGGKRDITVQELTPIVSPAARQIRPDLTIAQFLKVLEDASGLLIEQDNGAYRYVHPTFQEFLAARYFQRRHHIPLTSEIGNPWWSDTIRFFAELTDPAPVVEACLSLDSVTALVLASDCIDEADPPRPDLRIRLDQLLTAEGDGMSDRTIRVSEVRLALRLRRMIHKDTMTEASPSLITNAEYQLFLNDMMRRGERRQPDHWNSEFYLEGESGAPILGLRGTDAEAFCVWLTAREGGRWRYRLPFRGELANTKLLERLGSQHAGFAVWVQTLDATARALEPLDNPTLFTVPTSEFSRDFHLVTQRHEMIGPTINVRDELLNWIHRPISLAAITPLLDRQPYDTLMAPFSVLKNCDESIFPTGRHRTLCHAIANALDRKSNLGADARVRWRLPRVETLGMLHDAFGIFGGSQRRNTEPVDYDFLAQATDWYRLFVLLDMRAIGEEDSAEGLMLLRTRVSDRSDDTPYQTSLAGALSW